MAAYSFSSLVDMLKQPPSQNSNLMELLSSQPKLKTKTPYDDPCVTEMFGELYFKESSSSTLHFLFPPSSPPPPPPPPFSSLPKNPTLHTNIKKLSDKTNLVKQKSVGKHYVEENGCIYNKRSLGKKERLFPPPISCLKLAKSGKPFVYSRFDENSSRFVHEEIKMLDQDFLCASRETGHLKLNFVHEEEDEEEKDG